MNLALDELRAFLQTAERGTISAAARELGVSQPTLSWTIRKLEQRFATQLFVRSKQGVRLTRPGELLVSRSRELLRQWEQLEIALRDESEIVRGTYSIGVYPSLAEHSLPLFLPELLARWPELELDIGHDFSRRIAEDVIAFRYDYGIVVNPPRHPDLTIVELYQDEIGFWQAEGSDWRLDQPRLPVIYNPNMMHIETLITQLKAKGLLPDCRFVHSSDLRLISRLIAANGGVGILPDTVAETEHTRALRPCADSPTFRDTITLIWRSDAQFSTASKQIREAIRLALARE